MPSVTAIALETLLDPPGSSPSPRHAPTNPSAAPPPRPSTTASLKDHHHHFHLHHAPRPEQQPIFLSRQPRGAPAHVAAAPDAHVGRSQAAASRPRSAANGYFISPELYATPEPTRIVPTSGVSSSSSPTSVSSPSPYVVNHKRRGVPRPPPPPSPMATASASATNDNATSSSVEVKSHPDAFDSLAEPPDRRPGNTPRGLDNGAAFRSLLSGPVDELASRGAGGREGIGKAGEEKDLLHSKPTMCSLADNERHYARIGDDEEDDFFDPRELLSAMSTMSSSDTEDTGSSHHGGAGRCETPLAASQSEFYDATEDFFSDSSVSLVSPSSRANIEADLRSIRLNLFEEIDKRKKAEEALDHMQNMFLRVARQLSQVGLSSPPIQGRQYHADSASQLCQQVVVLGAVSEALESGLARVETEAAEEAIIEAKNHEISRLRDRLQYYEAMNQEMSQRNQEAIELARRRRQKRRMRRRWRWGCIGLAVTVGTSVLAYSYLVHGGKNSSLAISEHQDPSSGTTSSGD